MAMELATSRWSDRMHLTLAGFGEDLTALAPDRIAAVPTLDEALAALEPTRPTWPGPWPRRG